MCCRGLCCGWGLRFLPFIGGRAAARRYRERVGSLGESGSEDGDEAMGAAGTNAAVTSPPRGADRKPLLGIGGRVSSAVVSASSGGGAESAGNGGGSSSAVRTALPASSTASGEAALLRASVAAADAAALVATVGAEADGASLSDRDEQNARVRDKEMVPLDHRRRRPSSISGPGGIVSGESDGGAAAAGRVRHRSSLDGGDSSTPSPAPAAPAPASAVTSTSVATISAAHDGDDEPFAVEPGSDLQAAIALSLQDSSVAAAPIEPECVICMDPFDDDNPEMRTLCACGENRTRFHYPCLLLYLTRPESNQSCPTCRSQLYYEEQ